MRDANIKKKSRRRGSPFEQYAQLIGDMSEMVPRYDRDTEFRKEELTIEIYRVAFGRTSRDDNRCSYHWSQKADSESCVVSFCMNGLPESGGSRRGVASATQSNVAPAHQGRREATLHEIGRNSRR